MSILITALVSLAALTNAHQTRQTFDNTILVQSSSAAYYPTYAVHLFADGDGYVLGMVNRSSAPGTIFTTSPSNTSLNYLNVNFALENIEYGRQLPYLNETAIGLGVAETITAVAGYTGGQFSFSEDGELEFVAQGPDLGLAICPGQTTELVLELVHPDENAELPEGCVGVSIERFYD